ncbi:MAG: GNAT family N-acetyltransferase [Syntrophomonadaceae bacterium]|nr:GNAT family N-acetyltransferase [Syntrophomonadaceae bacterium]
MNERKQTYRVYCQNEKTIPIFSRDWWMDAVCGEDNWDVLLVERDNEIVASMPYFKKNKYGLTAITQPPLTQTNGIWIKYPPGQKYSSRLSYEKEVMTEIIDQLQALNVDYYCQNFHYSITNWQPFYWKGFQQTTRYTYVIDNLTNLNDIFSGFSKVVRKNIRRAAQEANVYDTENIDVFYDMNKLVFERQDLNIPYSFELIKTLDRACKEHNSRKIFCAEDETGRLHSILYLVWDEQSAYLLMSGTDPAVRDSNYKTLLVWEAIKHAANVTQKFDFEGSMIESIAEYFRKFGPKPKPYYQISKSSPRLRFLSSGREMLRTVIGK